jgi:hypothetical protein
MALTTLAYEPPPPPQLLLARATDEALTSDGHFTVRARCAQPTPARALTLRAAGRSCGRWRGRWR